MGLLEVRLEQEGHVALLEVAFRHLLLERREELGGELGLPQPTDLLDHRGGHLGVSPDHPGVEQSKGDAKVGLGDAQDLLGSPHRMVDLDPLIPQRVPERLGDLLDVAAPVVDQKEVEIGVGA